MTREARPVVRQPIPGTVHVNILLPEHLHASMQTIRQARCIQEGAGVRLYRIYREAIEQYVQAESQQVLLAAVKPRKSRRRG